MVLWTADEVRWLHWRPFELAWLARHDRIRLSIPLRSWLECVAAQVRSVAITPAIAEAATALPRSFPGDPADRLIYATALENGWKLVSKDERMHAHRSPRPFVVW
jgi:PIN domain nuclease of toxin-antitoxin system